MNIYWLSKIDREMGVICKRNTQHWHSVALMNIDIKEATCKIYEPKIILFILQSKTTSSCYVDLAVHRVSASILSSHVENSVRPNAKDPSLATTVCGAGVS